MFSRSAVSFIKSNHDSNYLSFLICPNLWVSINRPALYFCHDKKAKAVKGQQYLARKLRLLTFPTMTTPCQAPEMDAATQFCKQTRWCIRWRGREGTEQTRHKTENWTSQGFTLKGTTQESHSGAPRILLPSKEESNEFMIGVNGIQRTLNAPRL